MGERVSRGLLLVVWVSGEGGVYSDGVSGAVRRAVWFG